MTPTAAPPKSVIMQAVVRKIHKLCRTQFGETRASKQYWMVQRTLTTHAQMHLNLKQPAAAENQSDKSFIK